MKEQKHELVLHRFISKMLLFRIVNLFRLS
jgi:hypothetical protein